MAASVSFLIVCLFGESVTDESVAAFERAESAPKPAQHCHSLLKQFDAATVGRRRASLPESAEKLRNDGARLCSTGHYSLGARRLTAALAAIGVRPKIQTQ